MQVINIFGTCGAGKSTAAAGLFWLMKKNGFSVELINEYAKELTWAERHKMLEDQIYITAKQNHKMDRLRGKVKYCITDSPLLLGSVYKSDGYFPSYEPLLKEIFNSYGNLNFLLKRVHPFEQTGRNQSEQESNELATAIQRILNQTNLPYYSLNGDDNAPEKIFQMISEKEVKKKS